MSAIRKAYRQKTLDDLEPVIEPEYKDHVVTSENTRKKYTSRSAIDLYSMMKEFRDYENEDPLG